MQYLQIASGTIIVFAIALLLSKKGKRIPDYLLVSWFLLFLANIATIFIISQFPFPLKPWMKFVVEISESSLFLHGPFLWFYTRSLTEPGFRIRFVHALHVIPFVICFLTLISSAIRSDDANSLGFQIIIWAKMSSAAIYVTLNVLILNKHRRIVENVFSNIEKRTLNWLKFITWGMVVILVIGILSILTQFLTSIAIPQFGGLFINTALCLFIILMGYFGFRQDTVFMHLPVSLQTMNEIVNVEVTKEDVRREDVKYRKSGLDLEKSKEINEHLQALLKNQKVYLDQELTLFKLAEIIQVSANHLSQVINVHHGQNFFNFINAYRIEMVKERIKTKESQKLSLLGIAFDCGFNSKASFNRAFKKHTGVTPSEYKNQLERSK